MPPPTIERRRSARRVVNKQAAIMVSGMPPIDCVVLNMSDGGVGLEWKANHAIPQAFVLMLKPEMTKRNCQVVWRAPPPQRKIGVRFA